jgi:far upstream element-binding protein
MDGIIDYITEEENQMTVMVGAVSAAGALIFAAAQLGKPTEKKAPIELESDEKGKPQLGRLGGRQKKKVKHSKPVLPKKSKKAAEEAKKSWEESEEEEEEEVVPEPEPVRQPAKGKKGKKGKKAAAEEQPPPEEAWEVIPKKEKKKKASAGAAVVKGGKTVIDLGDKKAAVIGKGGSVIKGIQVRCSRSACRMRQLLRSEPAHPVPARVHRRALGPTSTSRSPATRARSAAMRTRCAASRPNRTRGHLTTKPAQLWYRCVGWRLTALARWLPVQVKAAKKQILAIIGAGSGPFETIELGKAVGAVIGRGGSTIKSIQAESGAKLDIEKDSDTVKISGSAEQIAAAKILINEAVEGPKPEAVVTVDVGSKGGTVIGRGGENIRKVQDESGARVEIEKGTGIVKISGSKAGVAKAQELIADLLDPKYDAKDFMDVGIAGVPLIVGKGGANIKRLQTESGAKIDIERGMTVVGIFGTDEAVAKARKMIETQLADSNYSETVECPASAIGAVIGKGGETIRSIQESSGARINVERDPPSVKLIGSKETVTKARGLVEEVLKKESKGKELPKGHVVETVELPKFAIGSIIGKGGASIAALQEDSGARVDIQRETDTAKVTGSKEAVAKAIESIKATVEAQTELQAKKDTEKAEKGESEPAAEKGDGWGENGNTGDW